MAYCEYCVIPRNRTKTSRLEAKHWRVRELLTNRGYVVLTVSGKNERWFLSEGAPVNGFMFETSHDAADVANWLGFPGCYRVHAGAKKNGLRKVIVEIL